MFREDAMGWDYRGDARRPARGEKIVSGIARTGSLVVREFGGGRAGEIAAHRFLGSPEVFPGDLIAEASERTAGACAGRRIVAVQDTTEINFSGADRCRPGLGPAGDGKSLGFFIHPVLAVDATDGAVLGLAGAKIWTRGPARVGNNQTRQIEDKESLRWIEAAATAAHVLATAASTIVVGDAESDIYQLFVRKPAGVDLIVRSARDRRLDDQQFLFAASDGFACTSTATVQVAERRGGAASRVAEVALSAGRVVVAKPKTMALNAGAAASDAANVTLGLVVVRETSTPPQGAGKPLLWRLLTTLPVETADQVAEVVRLYRLRWRIEEVFRALKSDGLALEETQIENSHRLFNLAALGLLAATRIVQLVDARDTSTRPATDIIDASLIEPVQAISKTKEGKTDRQKNHHEKGTLSWLAWTVARLGGWNCYYKPPGPKTMARGLKRLNNMLEGYEIAKAKSNL
jgi:hypothetical protein